MQRSSNHPKTIKFRSFLKNTIYDVLRKERGFVESNGDDWSIAWVNKKYMTSTFDTIRLEKHQRVNHFRTFYELCRKDYLIKNIKSKKRKLERDGRSEEAMEYSRVCPLSWILPHEYYIFENHFKKHQGPKNIYIMKPCASSQGKGISLVSNLSQLSQFKKERISYSQKSTFVLQKYIERPFLVGGKKFDMRIYVLVTSYNPLCVYIYREGFCRFSQHRYSIDDDDLENPFVHFTNVAIQKHSETYDQRGCKWSIRQLRTYLASKYGEKKTTGCFNAIQKTILLSLNSVRNIMLNDYHCFEMYGFDVLIDKELKPWILEINASPSLTASTKDDYYLKYHLLNDMLDIIDIEGQFKAAQEEKVIKNFCGFDLAFYDKKLYLKNSNLGWNIDRKKLRRKLMMYSSKLQK